MGEFSYAPTDNPNPGDFSAGYGDFGAPIDFQAGYGFQAEAQGLVAEDTPMLGAVLKEMGVLNGDTLPQVLAKQQETGVTFAQAVLDLGLVAPDQLLQAIQLRARYG